MCLNTNKIPEDRYKNLIQNLVSTIHKNVAHENISKEWEKNLFQILIQDIPEKDNKISDVLDKIKSHSPLKEAVFDLVNLISGNQDRITIAAEKHGINIQHLYSPNNVGQVLEVIEEQFKNEVKSIEIIGDIQLSITPRLESNKKNSDKFEGANKSNSLKRF